MKKTNKEIEYDIEIKYVDGYKIINKTPKMTPEEMEKKQREILTKIYNILSKVKW